jgi:hypothetical protein
MKTQNQPIRRHACGAIDTAYYCNRGRDARAMAARRVLRRIPVMKTAACVVVIVLAIAAMADVIHVSDATAVVR